MNDVTPELIAQIATRLYNEIPGANHIPKAESEAKQLSPEAVGLPAGLPGLPGVPDPRAERALSWDAAKIAGDAPAPPRPPAGEPDGLRAFVDRIRTSPYRAEAGVCGQTPDQDPIQRLFAGRSIPATGPPPLRRRCHPQGFPGPAPEGPRQAVGLARQRRHHAEAAERDRCPVAILRPRQLQHPPRGPHPGRPRDRRL